MPDQRQRGFVTAGTWCLDRNRKINAWPKEDNVAIAWDLEERGGGSACNFGVDIRLLDPTITVETIGIVGSDQAGKILLDQAQKAGIDHRQMHVIDGVASHVTEAFISQASGLRTHITEIGASALLTPDHFDLASTTGKYLHLGLPGIHPAMDRPWGEDANGWVSVLRAGKAIGMQTNLELCTVPPQRLRELILPCLPYLDTLIVNDSEIGALAGLETQNSGVTDIDACRQAALHILNGSAAWLVAVHFPGGAIAVTRDGHDHFVASVDVPPSAIIGPNGAGDAFAAGFVYGLHESWSIDDSLWMGHAVAACSLRTAGTTDGIEPWQDCLAIANAWGRRTG